MTSFLKNDIVTHLPECAMWWKEYIENEETILGQADVGRSIPRPEAYFPEKIDRAANPLSPPQIGPAPAPARRQYFPATDTIEHAGFRPAQRRRAAAASDRAGRRLAEDCAELIPGAFAFARFELDNEVKELLAKIDAGDEDAELEATEEVLALATASGDYRAPLCLVKLPQEFPSDPNDEFEVTWWRPGNNKYGGSWSEWRVKKGEGRQQRSVAWKARITRKSIVKTLENVEFTPGTAAKRTKHLSAKTKKILLEIDEAKYNDFK